MSLKQEILEWDGKSIDDIKKIFEAFKAHANFIDSITVLILERDSQNGATWLLKAWLESGNKLNQKQIDVIYNALKCLQHWVAKLHVLQCIPYLPIVKSERKSVELFLRITLTDPNKFVRAWSYNGFYELASQHSEYIDETKRFFEMAMVDEAASVKARIRNIMKKGFN